MRERWEQLVAGLRKNKTAVGVLGAGAVVVLAWRARSRSSSDVTPGGYTTAGGGVSTSPGYYSVGGQTSGATGYDSTASDVYNAIQPQLENLQRLWEDAQAEKASPVPVPVPEVTTPTPKPAPPADPRRSAIAGFYTNFLGREAQRSEVNFWDSTGFDLDGIRTRILKSPEAQKVTR